MNYLEQAKKVIDIEVEELQQAALRLGNEFEMAIELLLACTQNRNKIVVLGVGKSGHVGEKISATLTSTGSPSVVLNSLNALHGDLGVLEDGDVVLALSYSGETAELLNILPALYRFNVKLIAITGNPTSTLGRNSQVVLSAAVSREACPLGLAPTSSTTLMLVLGDALAMTLLEARGFSREDFAKFHPGGILGRSLHLKTQDIMRSGEQFAVVSEQTFVREVLKILTKKRAGAAAITGENSVLSGIFTHGDFVRHYLDSPEIGNDPVSRWMSPNPITIGDDQLAAEAIRLLNHHRIDDLIVVDHNHYPIGMIDTQDLTRFKLI